MADTEEAKMLANQMNIISNLTCGYGEADFEVIISEIARFKKRAMLVGATDKIEKILNAISDLEQVRDEVMEDI